MAKFNQKLSKAKKTQNYEAGDAFIHISPQHELYARVGTCLVKEPKFYGDATEEFDQIKALVKTVAKDEPDFILKLAAYARNILHLRSIPVALLGLASLDKLARSYVREYTPSIVKRADELAESIAFIASEIGPIGDGDEEKVKGTMLPHSLQKGLKAAWKNFNEYGFSKYDRGSSSVKMQDVIRLVHPKTKDKERKKLHAKIAKGELGSADTWEVLVSGEGSNKKTWEQAVKKMPIMALLRNLRNLLDKEVSDDTINAVIEKLTNEKVIQNSKQFPFRFFSAYKAIEDNVNRRTSKILTALDAAMFMSIKNLPLLSGVTAVFGDVSGSMSGTISDKSDVERVEIAAVLSAIASVISPDNVTAVFADHLQRVNFSQKQSILGRVQKMLAVDAGGSTNAYLAIEYLIVNKIKVDRIFFFSDMQCYDSLYRGGGGDSIFKQWEQYKREVNPNAYLYSFDLAGYGTTQVPEDDPHVLTIAGWSESILKYVPYFETEKETVLKEIRKITPATYLNKSE